MQTERLCRCGGVMKSMGTMDLQLGQYSFFGGHWSNLLQGSLPVEVMVCEECKHLELYLDEGAPEMTGIPVTRCEVCGKQMHSSYEKCPFCGHRMKKQ